MGIEDPGMVEHLITIAAEYEAEGQRLERQAEATPPRPFPEQ